MNTKKRALAILVPAVLVAAPVHADQYDCFPLCPKAEEAAPARLNLCEHAAVREVARVDRQLQPVKEIVDIATNPTGFALKMVDRHVVHIPEWVGFAMDPKGTIRAKVIERVRDEVKKQVGLERACVDEDARDGIAVAPLFDLGV